MIDVEKLSKLERLTYEAETAARALAQEVNALYVAAREKQHKDAQSIAPQEVRTLREFAELVVPSRQALVSGGVLMAKLVKHARNDPSMRQEMRSYAPEFDEVTRFLNDLTMTMIGERK